MRYASIVLLGIVGLIAGLTWGYISDGSYSEQWHQLPSPPSRISEFVTISDGTLFVKTLNGSMLQCSSIRNQCWIPGEISENNNWTKVTKPCDFSSSEFSFLTHPPKNISACIQGATQNAEALGKETYLIDTDGNVWEWHHNISGPSRIITICVSIMFAALGVIIGLFTLMIRRKRNPV